jgi:hypothetical protein
MQTFAVRINWPAAQEMNLRHIAAPLLVNVLLLAASGCARNTPPDLAELVIRQEYSGMGQYLEMPSNAAACISVDGRDANEKLLAELRDIAASVVPSSSCLESKNLRDGRSERGTGRKAIRVEVVRLGRERVQYLGYRDVRSAMRVILKVREENGAWRIVEVVSRELT